MPELHVGVLTGSWEKENSREQKVGLVFLLLPFPTWVYQNILEADRGDLPLIRLHINSSQLCLSVLWQIGCWKPCGRWLSINTGSREEITLTLFHFMASTTTIVSVSCATPRILSLLQPGKPHETQPGHTECPSRTTQYVKNSWCMSLNTATRENAGPCRL